MVQTQRSGGGRRFGAAPGPGGAAPPAAELVERVRLQVRPFASHLGRQEQQGHACRYVAGLLSPLPRKTAENIAYHLDQGRHGLQRFVGVSSWDWEPLLAELARQVRAALACPGGVVAFAVGGFAKKGEASVGVQRQRLGPVGKARNGQVAVYLGYASAQGAGLGDVRLYLPRAWAGDHRRRRRCGVPPATRYRTQAQLALEMMRRTGPLLPHAWVAADSAVGESVRFREALNESGERYLVEVPPGTPVRCLAAPWAPPDGRGGSSPGRAAPVERWLAAVPDTAWSPAKSAAPPGASLLTARVSFRRGPRGTPEETLVVVRRLAPDGTAALRCYLSNAAPTTPGEDFLAAAEATRRTATCLQRAVAEAGLADYEVRTWAGWHHHQTLALIAAWLSGRGLAGGQPGPERDLHPPHTPSPHVDFGRD